MEYQQYWFPVYHYILLYMVLAGKVQTPIYDLLWKLVSFAIIIAFINNAGGLLELAKGAIEDISTLGTAGKNGIAFVDDQFEKVSELATKLGNRADWGAGWLVSGLDRFYSCYYFFYRYSFNGKIYNVFSSWIFSIIFILFNVGVVKR